MLIYTLERSLVSKQDKITELKQIDIEIAKIEHATDTELVRQRTTLKVRRNSFMPASSFPFELLSRIFECVCFPEEGEGDWMIKERPTPFFLGTVCSAWRDVSLGTPQLWSYIVVDFDTEEITSEPARVRRWLKRAADFPLSIKIKHERARTQGSFMDDILKVFMALIERERFWQRFDGYLPQMSSHKMPCNFPMLSTLVLRAPNDAFLSFIPKETFSNVPLLRNVDLHGYDIGSRPRSLKIPYNQLERINVNSLDPERCVETLQLCPNLRYSQLYHIQRYDYGVSPIPPMNHLHHDHLQSLTLHTTALDIRDWITLLNSLTLPSLIDLFLSFRYMDPSLDIIPLISRSFCNLESLHLICDAYEEEIIQCLWVLPSLITLRLVRYRASGIGGISEVFLDSLHPSIHKRSLSSPVCLVPRLQHLEYRGPIDFSDTSLIDFLSSRWRHRLVTQDNDVAQLMSVIIDTSSRLLSGLTDNCVLHGLKREGMSLTFLNIARLKI